MVVFPNAKINLGLNVLSKRKDGFHDLESLFYPVPLQDALEIIPSSGETEIFFSGIAIDGPCENNLCMQVFLALQKQYDLPSVKIHLHKNIPIGAGLGGGSSDAAFTLKALNQLFHLQMSDMEMENFIRPFGSDCAFFIKNKPVLAKEKGDVFEVLDISLEGKYLVLIYPDLFISTREAYSGVVPHASKIPLRNIIQDNKLWKEHLQNDFENSLFPKYPILQNIKSSLYHMGATYASMSGSGSTVYGIFDSYVQLTEKFPSIYQVWQGWI